MTRMVVLTGLSGAGRSVSADAMEDAGWFVIDNLPPDLVPKVAELAVSTTAGYEQVCLIMRGSGTDTVGSQIEALSATIEDLTVVFLEASTNVLVRRYEATRRRHPLGDDASLAQAIQAEKKLMAPVRAKADVLIDTSDLNPHQLRRRLLGLFSDIESQKEPMRITLESFGFKHGLPRDVDVVLDCRFLPNPHWVEELRPQSGLDDAVSDYVIDRDVTQTFLNHLQAMLDDLLPAYITEGKSYLTIAFGCTGGRHRSVAVTEFMGKALTEKGWHPRIRHRDIKR